MSPRTAIGRLLPGYGSGMRPTAERELRRYGPASLLRGKRVLDVGCGDGRLALGAAALAASVVGVDPDPDAIAGARAQARAHGLRNVRFRVGAAQDLRFPSGAFDVVIFSWVL